MTATRRETCDRCRALKLRCVRTTHAEGEICTRCQRLRFTCVYSAALPKGRPSTRRRPTRALRPDCVGTAPAAPSSPSQSASASGPGALQDQDWEWLCDIPELSNLLDGFSPTFASERSESIATPKQPSYGQTPGTHTALDDKQSRPSIRPYPPAPDSTGACIQQLSDLNARLYPAHKICRAVEAGQKHYKPSIVAESALESLPELLEGENGVEPPLVGKCNAIYEVFRAARYLINILAQLHESSHEDNGAGAGTAVDQVSEVPSGSYDWSSQWLAALWTTASAQERPQDSEVVRYLLLGCYTRILQIFVSLAQSLHYDASCAKPPSASFLLARMSAVELRLVLLVQLLDHLYIRLKLLMHDFLAHGLVHEGAAPDETSRRSSEGMVKDSTAALEREVNGRLNALREHLRS